MTLVKTSLLTLISTAMKMLAGLVISKALALYVGPAGFAIVGQFQSFVQLLTTAAKGGIDNGIAKYTSQYRADEARLSQLFSTTARITVASSLAAGVVLVAGSGALSEYLLKSTEYRYVFVTFGCTVVLFALNSMLLSILNGLHEIRLYIAINIFQSLLTLVLTGILIVLFGIDGALLALVTNQSLVFVVVLWALRHHAIVRLQRFRGAFHRTDALQLSRYALMTVVSATVAPLTVMLVREHIGQTLGLPEAGYWQAAWYVSSVYLTVVTTSLAVYYLPKLSGLDSAAAIRAELRHGYAIVMPVAVLAALVVFVGKDLIIRLIFTPEFTPMRPLFKWLLIGDMFKIASWLLSYLMLAKAMSRAYIVTEVVFSASFVLLTMGFTRVFGLEGVMYAHALNYAAYFAAVALVTRPVWRSASLVETSPC
ncbi:O-antigen translocase [Piscinibacter koreensis]|uniref:O-antigen translocase n=1 Tax=Piscinibacter koreensis TaxID=2742824 RepID=A0A7Y6NRW3_9BURK|nr:O-antigen translocase [Schlegelella koreensis]NUZ08186.1 O-antigen translocase [Schlegelella koreensis]